MKDDDGAADGVADGVADDTHTHIPKKKKKKNLYIFERKKITTTRARDL